MIEIKNCILIVIEKVIYIEIIKIEIISIVIKSFEPSRVSKLLIRNFLFGNYSKHRFSLKNLFEIFP